MKIITVGDVHGNYGKLNILINKEKPDIVLQCGDFGFFPKEHGKTWLDGFGRIHVNDQYCIKNGDTKIHWCPGNHEDHETLEQLENRETMKNVFYQPKGSTLKLPDGRNVLFIGGAYSVDNRYRTAGYDWFPHLECVSLKDIENLPDEHIDIVISHSCPREFHIKIEHLCDKYWSEIGKRDCTPDALQIVLEKYKPKKWFFGHFHVHKRGKDKGCEWTALSDIMSIKRWWIEI